MFKTFQINLFLSEKPRFEVDLHPRTMFYDMPTVWSGTSTLLDALLYTCNEHILKVQFQFIKESLDHNKSYLHFACRAPVYV